jgi:hypothetical protein
MFYVFSYLPTATITQANAHVIEMHLTVGVIHQVDVLFQSGCNHQTFVQIRRGNTQVWPTNREEFLRGDATVISFRDFQEVIPGDDLFKALVWTSLTSAWKEVIIQIGLLPKKVLQPLSFDELLKAAAGG